MLTSQLKVESHVGINIQLNISMLDFNIEMLKVNFSTFANVELNISTFANVEFNIST